MTIQRNGRGVPLAKVIVVLVVMTAACGDTELQDPSNREAGERTVWHTPGMRVEPEVAEPGDVVDVFFPEDIDRGILLRIEVSIGSEWTPVYKAYTNAPWTDIGPETHPYKTGPGILDVGVTGLGPDPVAIPTDIEAGYYRICTEFDEHCAPLTIR